MSFVISTAREGDVIQVGDAFVLIKRVRGHTVTVAVKLPPGAPPVRRVPAKSPVNPFVAPLPAITPAQLTRECAADAARMAADTPHTVDVRTDTDTEHPF